MGGGLGAETEMDILAAFHVVCRTFAGLFVVHRVLPQVSGGDIIVC